MQVAASAPALQKILGHVQYVLAGAVALSQPVDHKRRPAGRRESSLWPWPHGSRKWPDPGRRCRKIPGRPAAAGRESRPAARVKDPAPRPPAHAARGRPAFGSDWAPVQAASPADQRNPHSGRRSGRFCVAGSARRPRPDHCLAPVPSDFRGARFRASQSVRSRRAGWSALAALNRRKAASSARSRQCGSALRNSPQARPCRVSHCGQAGQMRQGRAEAFRSSPAAGG